MMKGLITPGKPDLEKDGHKFWCIEIRGTFKMVRHEYPDGKIDYLVTVKDAGCWIADFDGLEAAAIWVDVNYQMGFRYWDAKLHRLVQKKPKVAK